MSWISRLVFIANVSLLLTNTSHAQELTFYNDETAFLAAAGAAENVDFEGIVAPGEFEFLGNPGEFSDGVINVENESPMFLQNSNFFGTGTFLSAQQGSPQRVRIIVPRNTVAAGFYYQSSEPMTVSIRFENTIALPAVPSGSLEFFGVTSPEPFRALSLLTNGDTINLDDIMFVVGPEAGIESPSNDGDGMNNVAGGGDLDTGFGDGGILLFSERPEFTDVSVRFMEAQQPGTMVVAGPTFPDAGEPELVISRIDGQGAVDNSFGNNGLTRVDVLPGTEIPTDMEILADGSVLIVGEQWPSFEGFIVKLDSDGNLDSGFGVGGISMASQYPSVNMRFDRIEAQNDGKLVLGADASYVYRFLSDGSPDLEFGAGGRAARFGRWGSFGLAIDADGTIVSGGGDFDTAEQDFEIVRHDIDGSVAYEFGLDGVSSIAISGTNDVIIDLLIDSKRRIVALGYSGPSLNQRTVVTRLLPDGEPDPQFGVGGVHIVELPDQTRFLGHRIEQRPDGGLLIAGSVSAPSGVAELAVVSLHENGTLDTGFAGQGWIAIDAVPTQSIVFIGPDLGGLAVLPDEKIAVLDPYFNVMTVMHAPDWQGRFLDVPVDFWAYDFIEKLAKSGITSGCGNDNYCPAAPVTRAQMAVFLERGINGSDFVPPAASGTVFEDVGAGDFAANFIEQLAADGITSGCGNDNYCPDTAVSRAQMAAFLLRARYGAGYSPPPATGVFADVDPSYWAVRWIEQLAAEGITAGCGNGNYCPEAPVTRAQMAVFLVRTFGL